MVFPPQPSDNLILVSWPRPEPVPSPRGGKPNPSTLYRASIGTTHGTIRMRPKRYMLVPLFGAIVGFVDWVLTRPSEAGMGALTFDDESPYVSRTEYI